MKLLVVAATAAEVQPLAEAVSDGRPLLGRLTRVSHPRHQIDILVTGVGMVATAAWCARALAESEPHLALNVGVCGSFNPAFPPPAVVHVTSDCLAELGAEDGEQFLTAQSLGLLHDDDPPFRDGRLVNMSPPSVPALTRLPAVRGITVSTVHGHEPSIARIVARWNPDVESMEGAAFMYACLIADVPFAQIRAVSNRVERRNRATWKLAEAITNLTDEVVKVVEFL